MASKRRRSEPLVVDEYPIVDPRGITAERDRHSGGHSEEGRDARGQITIRTMRDSPLDRAMKRKPCPFTDRQYAACIKYHWHWYRGGLGASLASVDPNRILAADATNFSSMARSESQAWHRQRYRAAVLELNTLSSIHAAVLEEIVCNERSFELIGTIFQFAHRNRASDAAEKVLRVSADKLVKLWGI